MVVTLPKVVIAAQQAATHLRIVNIFSSTRCLDKLSSLNLVQTYMNGLPLDLTQTNQPW